MSRINAYHQEEPSWAEHDAWVKRQRSRKHDPKMVALKAHCESMAMSRGWRLGFVQPLGEMALHRRRIENGVGKLQYLLCLGVRDAVDFVIREVNYSLALGSYTGRHVALWRDQYITDESHFGRILDRFE